MKKFWLILLSLFSAGVVLMILGFVAGAKTELFLDSEGFHLEYAEKTRIIKEDNIEPFENIDIDVFSADVEIIPSDRYGVEIRSQNTPPVSYSNKNGTLKIGQPFDFSWRIFVLNFHFRKDTVKIYVPKDKMLSDITIDTASGTSSISDITCDSIGVYIASGTASVSDCTANNVVIDCASGTVTLENLVTDSFKTDLVSGKVNASQIMCQSMSADIVSGTVDINGKITGDSQISLVSGKVKMTLDGKEDDYDRFIDIVSGSVYIDGEKDNTSRNFDGAKNSIDFDIVSGNADIKFKD